MAGKIATISGPLFYIILGYTGYEIADMFHIEVEGFKAASAQPTVELNDHFGTEGVQGVKLWLNACYKQMILFEIIF